MSSSASASASASAEAARLDVLLSSTRRTTVGELLLQEQGKHPEATGKFTLVLSELLLCCKMIASKMQRAGIVNVFGTTGETNVQGEAVKLMDVLSNDVAKRRLLGCSHVAGIVTEEEDEVIVSSTSPGGKYVIALDPLDGSSNIDCNVPVGTIFAIYRRSSADNVPVSAADFLQGGAKMVCAGYCAYGTSCMLVLSWGLGVNGFTLDPEIGEFVLSHPNMKMPAKRNIYSVNEGNCLTWKQSLRDFVEWMKQNDKASSRPYSCRYVGSMVADVHRTLLYGGLFMYPGSTAAPEGKLRYLYEVAPMSMLIEQAGGRAIIAPGVRALDFVPTSIHQRTPVFLGSVEQINLVEKHI